MLLKRSSAVRHLNGVNISKMVVVGWLRYTDKSFYAEPFQALVTRLEQCINVAGE